MAGSSSETIVGRRFTLVIPKAIRERLGLREGQRVRVKVDGERVVLDPLPADPGAVLDRLIRFTYDPKRDRKRAERWLLAEAAKRDARRRYGSRVRA